MPSLLDEPWPDPSVVIDAEPDLDTDYWEAFRKPVPPDYEPICPDCGEIKGTHTEWCMS